MLRARTLLVGGMVSALLLGCSVPTSPGPSDDAGISDPAAAPRDLPAESHSAEASERSVEVVDDEVILLAGDTRRSLSTLDPDEGAAVHAALRPGNHDEDTVLLLTRVDDELGQRYELRYLIATADTVSELFWFPWRLQVAEEVPAILDVAPLPVWAPDGSMVAWVEWVEQGTRLRTVGWIDDGDTRNPSDDASAYALADVPAGIQLETWQTDVSGEPVLSGHHGDQPYRIRLALGERYRSVVTAGR